VLQFIYERYRNQLTGNGASRQAVDAVLTLQPPLHEVAARVQACTEFALRPEAQSLAAANKRIGNLLKKADQAPGQPDPALLAEPAERALAQTIDTLAPEADQLFRAGDFPASMATLARARTTVDAFF